jgi:hypothetical protein
MQQKIVVAGAAVLAVALALPAAAVIFSGGGGSDSRCEEAHNAVADLSHQAGAARAETDRQQIADTQAYLIVGAAECFVPADVARAQQHIDMIAAR